MGSLTNVTFYLYLFQSTFGSKSVWASVASSYAED